MPARFREEICLLLLADLVGFCGIAERGTDLQTAELLDTFYRGIEPVVRDSGGRVVKHMGDSVLIVFPEEHCAQVITTVARLRAVVDRLGRDRGLNLRTGFNLHVTPVVSGSFGERGDLDVVGAGVNQCFMMGRGAGVRISQAVLDRLPDGQRGHWQRSGPPITYSFEG